MNKRQAAPAASRPPRVLHIVESIDRGAVENWLLRLYRHARANVVAIDWTFYCILPEAGSREGELTSLGARVVRSPVALGRSIAFARELRAFAARERFDIIHAHHDILSGLYLLAVAGLPVRSRIVHAHNADLSLPTPSRLKARLFAMAFNAAIRREADKVAAISSYVADQFIERVGVTRGKTEVLLYGIDTEPFARAERERARVRRSFSVANDETMLLFIGRMTWFKNPVFVVDILAELRRRGEKAVAVFAGTGPEEEAVRRRARELGVQSWVHMAGWRDDGPELMAAADAFVFPRDERETDDVGKEGLGFTVVESQAAGLPVVVSRAIPNEALVVPALCHVVPGDAGVAAWADTVSAAMKAPRMAAEESTKAVESSALSTPKSLAAVVRLHTREAIA